MFDVAFFFSNGLSNEQGKECRYFAGVSLTVYMVLDESDYC